MPFPSLFPTDDKGHGAGSTVSFKPTALVTAMTSGSFTGLGARFGMTKCWEEARSCGATEAAPLQSRSAALGAEGAAEVEMFAAAAAGVAFAEADA